ncbi:hypothetical protein P0136_02270 [Lentisphaerota bacterium ZTH]|nr:hypothetical protein JYG24_06590 [Lentisphaerota bacterium]WET06831.1 hypothetical protein P0136_02270 [Lentisphaerota bacterium ZTH]
MSTICPYCNIEVSESMIEAEDGCCPECGSIISVSSIFSDGDTAAYDEGDDFDEIEEEELLDEDDLENKLFNDEEFDDDEFDYKEEFGDEEFDEDEEEF